MRTRKKLTLFFRFLLLCIVLAVGVGLMAYPFIANYIFENRQDSIVETYENTTSAVDRAKTEALIADAEKYNEAIASGHIQLHDPFSETAVGYEKGDYYKLLSVDDSNIIGTIEIPSISVSLPVYHGTAVETLEKGIGHLEGTSLPIGGASTHCVLTGHTGLSSAKLFTDISELVEGDLFILKVLDDKLAYKVDQIKVVEPTELDDLKIVPGEDLCTLVTCTPYGVNTHRLLVRGTRIPYVDEDVQKAESIGGTHGNSQWMRQYKRSLAISCSLILVMLVVMVVKSRKKKQK